MSVSREQGKFIGHFGGFSARVTFWRDDRNGLPIKDEFMDNCIPCVDGNQYARESNRPSFKGKNMTIDNLISALSEATPEQIDCIRSLLKLPEMTHVVREDKQYIGQWAVTVSDGDRDGIVIKDGFFGPEGKAEAERYAEKLNSEKRQWFSTT